jgi:lipoprotein-releasing system permease protein
MFEFFIALRHLRAKRKHVVISIITVISILGVTAGVMSLVIALAINTGFRDALERNLLGASGHVMILEKEPGEGISDWREVLGSVSHLRHVVSAEPGLYDNGYLNGPIDGSGVIVKGIPVQDAKTETLLNLKSGSLSGLAAGDNELPAIILGSRLAEKLGAVTGKQVTLLIPNGRITPFGAQPSYVRMRLAGIFESGSYDIDSTWAYMSLPAAQKAYGLGDVVNTIELRLDDIYAAAEVAAAADQVIGPKLGATTWQEQNRQILNALRMERVVTMVTIGLILLVAALQILTTLVMMVMEKYRDIAVLMSMGATTAQIRRIFLLEGALIGAIGTGIGLALGYTLSYFADRYRWLKLDEQIYPLSFVPFQARWVDGLWIAGVALLVSLIATLYPARSATQITPVEALRYE